MTQLDLTGVDYDAPAHAARDKLAEARAIARDHRMLVCTQRDGDRMRYVVHRLVGTHPFTRAVTLGSRGDLDALLTFVRKCAGAVA